MSPVSRGRKPKRSKKSKNGKKPPVRTISSGWARTSRRESGGPRPQVSPSEQLFGTPGDVLPEYSPRYHDIDVAPMADPFAAWYAERHGHEPDREAVEALAREWLEGMLPGTEHSVSPHRSEYFRELIDDWNDDPVTDAVRALLPAWVRWNGEQAGVPASLLERAVGVASART